MITNINNYIIEEDFPYDNILQNYKERMINHYLKNNLIQNNIYDLHLPQGNPVDNLIPSINRLISNTFHTETPIRSWNLNLYVQNNSISTSLYHNHIGRNGYICAVFYTNLPKEGGEITFLVQPSLTSKNEEITIKPQINKIYFFPFWLYHSPRPQKDQDYRLCFNYVHNCRVRPVVKETLVQW